MKIRLPIVLAAASLLFGAAALAADPTPVPAPASASAQGSTTPIAGGIIGNVKSHVYHLPGDKGKMPGEKNRVYFQSEADAQAAGYHRSGLRKAKGTTSTRPHKTRVRKPKAVMPAVPSTPVTPPAPTAPAAP